MRTLLAIIPSVGVLFLFVLAIRAILQADRRERAAQSRYEAGFANSTTAGPAPVSSAPAEDQESDDIPEGSGR